MYTMQTLLITALTALGSLHRIAAMPLQYTLNHHQEECLYEKLNTDESFTASVFVLSGSKLEVKLFVDGPVAPASVETAFGLLEHTDKYDHGQHHTDMENVIHFKQNIDFESYNVADDEEEEEEEIEEPKEGETTEEQRARRARERRKTIEARQRQERAKNMQKKKVREEGMPFQQTFQAKSEGWYQMCVEAQVSAVVVELDLRKESDYGGLNSESQHVLTRDEKDLDLMIDFLEKDTAEEEGIKDSDFQLTRDKLKTLRRLLADIQSKQTQERHRLMVHSATNEHSHSRMVLSSLLETVLFMLVTGFQVFTIRRWFTGAPVLGR